MRRTVEIFFTIVSIIVAAAMILRLDSKMFQLFTSTKPNIEKNFKTKDSSLHSFRIVSPPMSLEPNTKSMRARIQLNFHHQGLTDINRFSQPRSCQFSEHRQFELLYTKQGSLNSRFY